MKISTGRSGKLITFAFITLAVVFFSLCRAARESEAKQVGVTVSPASKNHSATAGEGSFETICDRRARYRIARSVNDDWIRLTGSTSGIRNMRGGTTVSYTVASNPSSQSRTGTIVVRSIKVDKIFDTFTVTQDGAPCNYKFEPPQIDSVGPDGTTGKVTVKAAASDCSWRVTESLDWIAINSGSDYTGSKTVRYTVTANASFQSRTGTITIADQTFTVTQAGVIGNGTGDMLHWDDQKQKCKILPAPSKNKLSNNKNTLSFCNGVPTWTDDGCTYTIGDTGPAGGIVFYINPDSGGSDGLEAAPQDQSTAVKWGCSDTTIGTETSIGSGASNTAAILAGCTETGIAAKVANDYSLNGYDDWFLPSRYELNQLYLQKGVVGGFGSGSYWSSSEENDSNAWYLIFSNGQQYSLSKGSSIRVRAVRAF